MFQDADKKVAKIASQLESKLNETFSILNQTRNIIETYYGINKVPVLPSAISPCNQYESDFAEYEVTNMLVNPSNSYAEQSINLNQGNLQNYNFIHSNLLQFCLIWF